jgi:cell shape-determining protein MreC
VSRPEFRISSSVAVVGFALIALTPAAPSALRRIDALFVHLYRPLDAVIERAHAAVHPEIPESLPLPEPLRNRVVAGLRAWNAVLRSGLRESGPNLDSVVARVVALDRVKRLLLVDAGPDVEFEPGDPVSAGASLVGRVVRANNGVAVVETPWTRDVRFAGAIDLGPESDPIRFVVRGLDREEVVAAVTNPERREGLRDDLDVFVPNVSDLLPESLRTPPMGLLLGKLSLDTESFHASGEVAYLLQPSLDIELLDAVVIAFRPGREVDPPEKSFERRPLEKLTTSMLSNWRDGFVAVGSGAAIGSAVLADDHFVGVVADARFGTVRIRGVFDPGNRVHGLAVTADDAFPLELAIRSRAGSDVRATVLRRAAGRQPAAGDLLVSAGREAHTPRGLMIGAIVAVSGDEVILRAPTVAIGCRLDVLTRIAYPANPWGS